MAEQNMVIQSPTATMPAGSYIDTAVGGLASALALWGQYEDVKAKRSAAGGDQIARLTQPELNNGAAVQIDQQAQPATQTDSTKKVDKTLVFLLGALVVVGLYARKIR